MKRLLAHTANRNRIDTDEIVPEGYACNLHAKLCCSAPMRTPDLIWQRQNICTLEVKNIYCLRGSGHMLATDTVQLESCKDLEV